MNRERHREKYIKLPLLLHFSILQAANKPFSEESRQSVHDLFVAFTGKDKMTETRIHNQTMIPLDPHEILAVLRTAKAKGPREWAMILLAYRHGMRASEVCNLRLADIDLKNGSVIVERLKGSLRTTQAVTGHRGEPLLDELKALRDWLRLRPNDGSDFVFSSQKGGRLDRSQFFRLFKAIAADAGLPPEKRHPHALKHSIANHLISANVNLALVKQALGHKSINSTMRYIATTDKAASQATATALMSIY